MLTGKAMGEQPAAALRKKWWHRLQSVRCLWMQQNHQGYKHKERREQIQFDFFRNWIRGDEASYSDSVKVLI